MMIGQNVQGNGVWKEKDVNNGKHRRESSVRQWSSLITNEGPIQKKLVRVKRYKNQTPCETFSLAICSCNALSFGYARGAGTAPGLAKI
jgi:hypothetical protein